MALVRASRAAQKAVDDELARQREPDPGQTLFDFGYLSPPGEIQSDDAVLEAYDGHMTDVQAAIHAVLDSQAPEG